MADCSELGARLKAIDLQELNDTLAVDGEEGLKLSLTNSVHAYTLADHNDVPVAMGGIGVGEHGGIAWVLTDSDVKRYGRQLTAAVASALSAPWALSFQRLYNYVSAQNATALRWLSRLGFKPSGQVIINSNQYVLMNKEVIK